MLQIKLYFFLLIYLTPVLGTGTVDLGPIPGCKVPDSSQLNSGFKGNFYYHPWVEFVANNSPENIPMEDNSAEYLDGGYAANNNLITYGHSVYTKPGYIAKDVVATNISFNNIDFCDAQSTGDCFDQELWTSFPNFVDSNGNEIFLPTTNLVYHMVGLIIPPQSGKYTFHLNYIDDVGIVGIGSGLQNAADCCSNFNASGQVLEDAKISASWTESGPSSTNVLDITLLKGVAYPISVFYLNVGGLGAISVSYVDPNGVNHTDFSGLVYNKKDTSSCAYASITTSTLPWGQSKTS